MCGIDSTLTVTGMSDVELDAWIEFLYEAFHNVGLGLGIARTEKNGDTSEYRYCLDGPSYAFVKGVPQVMKYACAFAKSLAMLMHTTPDKYITAILAPILNDCQACGTEVDVWKQIFSAPRENAPGIASQDPGENSDPQLHQSTLNEVRGVLNIKKLEFNHVFAWLACLLNAFQGIGVLFLINDLHEEDGSWVIKYHISGRPGSMVERFQIFNLVMGCFSNALAVIDKKTPREYAQRIMKPILASCLEMYPELSEQKIYHEPDYSTWPTWLKNFCERG